MVRAMTAAGDEPAQEGVDVDAVGLEHFDAHAVGETQLARGEPWTASARHPAGADDTDEPGPRVGPPLDGDGDVVEVGAPDGHERLPAPLAASRTTRDAPRTSVPS